ncbi:HTH-type transcriptional regulator DmlR [compost metagenome]
MLKVSLAPSFGMAYVLPLLPDFLKRYPAIRPEWHFENRAIDLIAEGFDAAIGGGFELAPGLVSRALAPAHVVAVASPAYLRERTLPADPSMLNVMDGIVMRSGRTGRTRQWAMRDAAGNEVAATMPERIVVSDPAAMREAALLGLGVTLLAVPDVLPWIERGELVRLLPRWYADAGAISLYYPTRTLIPTKTRVFIEYVVEAFRQMQMAERLAGSLGI